MQSLGMEEGVPIESRLITRQIERAQKEVEARNFSIRKHLLEYDDVMNKQREEIYRFRRELLEGTDQREYILGLAEDIAKEFLDDYAGLNTNPDDWDLKELGIALRRVFGLDPPANINQMSRPEVEEDILGRIREKLETREQEHGPEMRRFLERMVMLQIIDQQWKDHLLALDHLKEGIGLRGYGQRDPKVEYKRESFALFEDLWNRATEEMVRMIFLLEPAVQDSRALREEPRQRRPLSYSSPETEQVSALAQARANRAGAMDGRTAAVVSQVVRKGPKVGRNDPCPCGSGKKYKKCCGR
jgi:preprotein translocase subunit SecA